MAASACASSPALGCIGLQGGRRRRLFLQRQGLDSGCRRRRSIVQMIMALVEKEKCASTPTPAAHIMSIIMYLISVYRALRACAALVCICVCMPCSSGGVGAGVGARHVYADLFGQFWGGRSYADVFSGVRRLLSNLRTFFRTQIGLQSAYVAFVRRLVGYLRIRSSVCDLRTRGVLLGYPWGSLGRTSPVRRSGPNLRTTRVLVRICGVGSVG